MSDREADEAHGRGGRGWLARLRRWAHALRVELDALALACRDPSVPWHAKAVAAAVVAYALSPIDIVPDFVPILGYVDDLVLLPLGILLAIRLVGPERMSAHRAEAERGIAAGSSGWRGIAVVVVLWTLVALAVQLLWHAA